MVEQAFAGGRALTPFPFPVPPAALLVAALVVGGAGIAAVIAGRASVPAEMSVAVSMPVISNVIPERERQQHVIPPAPNAPVYAVAVVKSAKELLILKEEGDFYQVIKKFDISLGRVVGAKEREGDLRTPVGYYHIVEIKDGKKLPAIYGPKVFVTDYPNAYDIAKGRSGGGIWLHGSGKGKRLDDTHGCVELDDQNVMQLEKWVGVNTPVIIYPETFQLPVTGGRIEKRFVSMEFFYSETRRASTG